LVFSSHIFLFWFLPLALLLYYAVPVRARSLVLTLVSYVV
jgi:alginate O-acetyltransferase complex protein AlgI